MGGLPSGAGALVGQRLGNYELVALLALGGTAEIYLARIDGTAGFEKYVVVKCLHDHLADDREFVQMFLDEARLGAQLAHSNIVQTLGLGAQDDRYYLVMEHIAGMSLALMARRATERVAGGRIPVALVLGAAVQACGGLHYAHEVASGGRPLNLIHRDVSPQNLVVTFEGVVKIVDFGIAKAEERETATRSGTIKGKFAYMSPEQCQARDVDRRTDVFALGVVVHELITGRRLFKRPSTYDTYQAILECKVPAPSSVNHELDPALDPVVMKALARNPSQRYPTAEAFGEAMAHYLHTRGKAGGASDIAAFIERHYTPEIEDHGARMRELLAGRPAAAIGWDDPDDPGSAAAIELSQFELIDELVTGGAAAIATADADAGAEAGDPARGDDDELPAEATRIELNPMAQLAELEAVARRTGPQPVVAAAPGLTTPIDPPTLTGVTSSTVSDLPTLPDPPSVPEPPPPARATLPVPAPRLRSPSPQFGVATPGGSMFGGPPGGLKAGPLPAAAAEPAPAPRPSPSIFGGPTPPTSRPSTVPPVASPPPRESPRARSVTAPAPVVSPPVAPRSFGPAEVVPTVLAQPDATPATAPAARGFAAAPEAKTMISDDGLELGRSATVPAMGAMAPPPGVAGPDQPTHVAPYVDPQAPVSASYQAAAAAPFPSGELLVPAHGTPPGTFPSGEMTLPAHLIGLPSIESYAAHPGAARRLPPWLWPLAIGSAVAVVIGVIAAVAT
ncbi:MAG TPA: protein kinase [Kofleriaceae bacterium]|nr:protein kinase [Kofleriaceae bacterium]